DTRRQVRRNFPSTVPWRPPFRATGLPPVLDQLRSSECSDQRPPRFFPAEETGLAVKQKTRPAIQGLASHNESGGSFRLTFLLNSTESSFFKNAHSIILITRRIFDSDIAT